MTAGTLQLGHNSALGAVSAGTTVSSGATLDFNGYRAGPDGDDPLLVSGTGVGNNGVLVNNRSGVSVWLARDVTLAGNATFGSNQRWDIRDDGVAPTTTTFNMNGFTLTKVGGLELCLVNAVVNNPGSVNVNQQIFRLEGSTDFDGSGTISVVNGGTLDFYGNTQTHNVNVILAGGANLTTNGGGGPTLAGTVTLNGIANFGLNNNLTISGKITGGRLQQKQCRPAGSFQRHERLRRCDDGDAGTVQVLANGALGTTPEAPSSPPVPRSS